MIDEQKIIKFRDALLQMQSLSAHEMQRYQDNLLAKLVIHASANVPFYAPRLRAALGSPVRESWGSIPFLTRADVQQDYKDLAAKTRPLLSGPVQEDFTSGSTGRPLKYLHEELLDVASLAQSDRVFSLWGLDGEKSLGTFMSIYDDPSKRGLKRFGWRLGQPSGIRQILELSNDIDSQIEWLKEVKPTYLFARGGAHIEDLSWRALARGERLRFSRILTTGSGVNQKARSLAKKAFKCNVVDLYGASETGLIAYECPDCGKHHGCDETMFIEILRDDGLACEEGETGRVVVTPLYAYAMPLIRYELGDYAIRGPARASCGRPVSSLETIVGRYRAAFILRDGRVIHPYANATRIGEHLSYRQIQLVQTDFEHVEVRYVPDDPAKPTNVAGIQTLFRQFMPGVIVTLVPVKAFALDPNGKFEETVSLVSIRLRRTEK